MVKEMAVLREENERMLQRQLKFKEEMDEDLNALKELKNEFENSKPVLKMLNDDKRAMELTQRDVKKAED